MKQMPTFKGFNITQEEKENALKNNRLLTLIINMNKGCNFGCVYCYRDAGICDKEQLSLEEYKKTIDEAVELGAKNMHIPGAGEPFLDKVLYDRKNGTFPILDYANAKGLHVSIFTNATQITQNVAQKLYEKDVSIMCKLNSFDEKIQDKLSNKPGLAKKLHEGIRNLINAGFNRETPTRLSIDTLICNDTREEVPRIVDWAVENNIYPVVEDVLLKGRAIANRKDLVLDEDYAKHLKLVKEVRDQYNTKYSGKGFFGDGTCDLDQYSITIDYNGNAVECPGGRFDYVAGNVRQSSLKDLWNSPRLVGLRRLRNIGCNGLCPGRIECHKKLGLIR